MGGLHWSWPFFGMGGVASAVMALITIRAAMKRTGHPPWHQFRNQTRRGKLWWYWTLTVLSLPVGGLAAEVAVNLPMFLVVLGAGATPQTIFVLLGAGESDDDGPDE